MQDINVEADLTSVTEQIGKLVEELNKVNAARENLIQQVQNLNGVGMYLRGKLQPNEGLDGSTETLVGDELNRSAEYPETTS
tara:strand:+ start:1045 stop:1290 length:246 start_codon:yes stop_codon:yes gene_type:complete